MREPCSLTSRFLNEEESAQLMEWLFENDPFINGIEEMSVNETKKILPLWENNDLLKGQWTVSFTDIEVAIYFRLRWCDQ